MNWLAFLAVLAGGLTVYTVVGALSNAVHNDEHYASKSYVSYCVAGAFATVIWALVAGLGSN